LAYKETMSARIIVYLLVIAPIFGQTAVSDVCTAAKADKSRDMTVRGTGMLSRGRAILFDYTCPLGSGNGFVLPTAVLVEEPSFAEPAIEARFRLLKNNSLFQALLQGHLECADPFQVQKGDDGDIIGANGYGHLNLYRCRMRAARILMFHIVDTNDRVHLIRSFSIAAYLR
jgi:hypothetical protein